jgi:hypothetical protein
MPSLHFGQRYHFAGAEPGNSEASAAGDCASIWELHLGHVIGCLISWMSDGEFVWIA